MSSGVDQFFNEVNLISGIQHKNIVRLLGCSIKGSKSFLVYEYVPNKSLDQIMFGMWFQNYFDYHVNGNLYVPTSMLLLTS